MARFLWGVGENLPLPILTVTGAKEEEHRTEQEEESKEEEKNRKEKRIGERHAFSHTSVRCIWPAAG